MKVKWDDYKPNINGKIKNGNQTTNQIRDNTNLIFFDNLGVMTMNQYAVVSINSENGEWMVYIWLFYG